jgi:hypothetical protein
MLKYFVELQQRKDLPEVKASKKVTYSRDSQRLALLAGPKGVGTLQTYLVHDAASDAFIYTRRKLHVVTRPGLVTDIGIDGVHASVENFHKHINYILPTSEVESNSFADSSFRRKRFQESLPMIRSESDQVFREIYKTILDGYFISLSGRAMLKKIIERLIARFYSPMRRNRQR